MFERLFSPLQIGPVTIKNRIQITPHELQYFRDGLPTDTLTYYYVERAKGGAGLLEVSQIYVKAPTGIIMPDWEYDSARRFPMVSRPEIVPGLKSLSDAVHLHGARMFMEISAWSHLFGHVSSMPYETGLQLKELTQVDIRDVEQRFGIASKYVKDGGFDGVDLHGTHGSLIEQFCSPATNKRTDRYGGIFENRMRFLSEVLDVVRAVTGDSLALGMRLCADERLEGGITPEYAAKIAQYFDGKLDFVNVDSGSFSNFEALDQSALQTQPLYAEPGYGVYMSASAKKAVNKTKVGIVGRITDPLLAEQILEREQADYVGMTRALIADPELPRKAAEGRVDDIRPCIGTLEGCWARSVRNDGSPMRCTVNASVGREKERGIDRIEQAITKKRILIIGGGPAGLEAARVASERRHVVSIYEKNSNIGGQINLAKRLPGRSDLGALLGWYESQLRKNGVRLKLNMEVPSNQEVVEFLVREEKPDVVILATGSTPIVTGLQMISFREVPGWNRKNVHRVDEILRTNEALRGNVVVADSTTYIEGPCIAEWLAIKGGQVTLITPHTHVSPELWDYNQSVYLSRRLSQLHIREVTFSWIRAIEERTVVAYFVPTGVEREIEADHVILNTGRQPNDYGLGKLFSKFVQEVYEIGDCDVAGGKIRGAIEAGYKIGSSL